MKDGQIMEIEWQCNRLNDAFAFFLDRKEYQKVADLFTTDGVFLRNGVKLVGRQEIVAALSKRPANLVTRHVTTGAHFLSITVNRAEAVSCKRSYFGMLAGEPPAGFKGDQVALLDFEDTFTLTDDGWRIAQRITKPILLADALRASFGT